MEAGHFDSVVYLRLWSGDLQGALQLATERGELNDHLLSVAPMGKSCGFESACRTLLQGCSQCVAVPPAAGFTAWSGAVEAYVRQLVLQEQYLKAASHLLSVHRVHEAVDLLRTHRLFRSAGPVGTTEQYRHRPTHLSGALFAGRPSLWPKRGWRRTSRS